MLYGKASSYYGFFASRKLCPYVDFAVSRYSFLLLSPYPFASFQAQCFIIRQKVRENRNIFGLLCLRLIFLFLLYGICVTKQRVFTLKLLVACLRPVTRPLFTQKWATFYA